jgi:hypothetical protein
MSGTPASVAAFYLALFERAWILSPNHATDGAGWFSKRVPEGVFLEPSQATSGVHSSVGRAADSLSSALFPDFPSDFNGITFPDWPLTWFSDGSRCSASRISLTATCAYLCVVLIDL